MQNRIRIFFIALFLTTLLPYLPYIFPLLPVEVLEFNLTGWAWLIMLIVTISNLFNAKSIAFPITFWAPWMLYIVIYLAIDFTFLGLQLTLQYSLPILIGIVCSSFEYSDITLNWIIRKFSLLCAFIYVLFLIGFVFRGGYTPATAATPMLLTIMVSILTGLWFLLKEKKYLFLIVLLFLVPVLDVTRMGIIATGAIFIFHFANNNLISKALYITIGLVILLFVFNTKRFQEKTFYDGKGKLSDLAINYYDNPNVNSSGRTSWKNALQPGLETSPIWGNGPRADNHDLSLITGRKSGEAHNDYLSVRYNYGYVGLALLLFGFVGTFFSVFRISRRYIESEYLWILSTSLLSLFISFMLFMYSDNILKYTIYFPNYFYALIGIVYSMKHNEDICSYSALQ